MVITTHLYKLGGCELTRIPQPAADLPRRSAYHTDSQSLADSVGLGAEEWEESQILVRCQGKGPMGRAWTKWVEGCPYGRCKQGVVRQGR